MLPGLTMTMSVMDLLRALRVAFTVPNTDDGIVLKADAFRLRADRGTDEKLAAVAGYMPPYSRAQLRALPDGSFGREYARFQDVKGLRQFSLSPALSMEVIKRNVLTARFRLTHDMFHVILGFDNSLAGELGVMAFSAAQGYGAAQRRTLWAAALFYPLYRPHRALHMFRCISKGWRMGRKARFLLGERLEDRFAEPLEALRRDLNIDAAPLDTVLPSAPLTPSGAEVPGTSG